MRAITVALCLSISVHVVNAQDTIALKLAITNIIDCDNDSCRVARAINLAQKAIDTDNLANAVIIAQRGLGPAKESRLRAADLYELKGQVFFRTSIYDSAGIYFDSALLVQSEPIERARLRMYKGYLEDVQTKYVDASRSYKEALEQFNKTGSTDEEFLTQIRNGLGQVALHLGRYDEAMTHANWAAENSLNRKDYKSYVDLLQNMADINLKNYYEEHPKGDDRTSALLKEAAGKIRQALSVANDHKEFTKEDKLLLNMTRAEIAMEQKDWKEAKKILDGIRDYGVQKLVPEKQNVYRVLRARYRFHDGKKEQAYADFLTAIDSARGQLEKVEFARAGKLWYLNRTDPAEGKKYAETLNTSLTATQFDIIETAKAAFEKERLRLIKMLKDSGIDDQIKEKKISLTWIVNILFGLGIGSLAWLVIVMFRKNYDNAQIAVRAAIAVIIVLLGLAVYMIVNPNGTTNSKIELFGSSIESDNVGIILIFMVVAILGFVLKLNSDKKKSTNATPEEEKEDEEEDDENKKEESEPTPPVVTINTGETKSENIALIDSMIADYQKQLIVTKDVIDLERIKMEIRNLRKKREELLKQ